MIAANPLPVEAMRSDQHKNRGVRKRTQGGGRNPRGRAHPPRPIKFGQIRALAPYREDLGAPISLGSCYVHGRQTPASMITNTLAQTTLTKGNMFISPDGMGFSSDGML